MTYALSTEDIKRCRQISMRHNDRIKAIALAVAAETSIPISAIYGPSRKSALVAARQIVMFLARKEGLTFETIGNALNKDHKTVIVAVRRERECRGEVAE